MAFLIGAYLLGSFPTAGLVGGRAGRDPSAEGSGNPGATNVYRLMGRRAAAFVLLGDMAKGVIAALAGGAVGDRTTLLACGGAAVLGHCFPAGRWGRGGKGVATAAGVATVAFPVVAVLAAAAWIALARLTRTASVASLVAMAGVPVGATVQGRPTVEVVLAAAIAAVVLLRHRANVERLLRGEEHHLH